MNIKVNFDSIEVKEDRNNYSVKLLMLKGEKGDQGDGEPNVIEKVQVNGTDLPVTNKSVNIQVPTVDSAISSSSTNPVQNNAIYNALSNKVDNSALSNYYEISEVDALLSAKDVLINKKPYYFNNIAEMKAYDLQEGDYAITKGYYSANDGGAGQYEIVDDDTLNDDGGSIHELTNGLRAKLIIDDTINVKVFGAKGDGETDDSTSIQNAIDFGKDIFLPEGNYLILTKLEVDKNIHLYGIGKDSILLTNTDIIMLEGTGESINVVIENLQFKNVCVNRVNNSIYLHDLKNLFASNLFFNNIETGGKSELYIKNIITSIVEKSIFNHSSLKLETWDCKVDKCWIWALSQDYGILIGGSSGNINIANVDIVPPLQSNSNYVSHANMLSNWETASLQAGIVIGTTTPVTNVKMTNIYIDGNPSLVTGRGIIINKNSANILLNDWSANKTNDDLVIVDSSYGITISNGELLDCFGYDCCLIQVIKTSTQTPHTISISNNTIILRDTTQLQNNKLRSVIECLLNINYITISYNKCWSANVSGNILYEHGIYVDYSPSMLLYSNRMSGEDFYIEKSNTIASGSTGATISYGVNGFKYTPSLSNINLSFNKIVDYRIQQTSANTIYVAFKEALASDTIYDLIVKL